MSILSNKKVILIKYGELALKGRNRPDFERVLQENIANALGIKRQDVLLAHGRMYISHSNVLQNVGMRNGLSQVFGIVKYATAIALPQGIDLEPIKDAAISRVEEAIGSGSIKTFRLETNRASKRFPLDSMEVNRQLGGAVLERFPQLGVELEDPDLTINAEIREEGSFVYSNFDEHAGPGGLPVGASSAGLLLLSGGIDSPVAGWMMMKRGMPVDAVYFHSFPYTGDKTKEKVIDLARILAKWRTHQVTLFVVPFADIQKAINASALEGLWTILHRRAMMRIAEQIAAGRGAAALITGENLGQVASQTAQNIAAVEHGTALPVFRPLLGFDKSETIDLAKRIGTFETSILPYEDCCTVFASQHPSTGAEIEGVLSAEHNCALDKNLQAAMAGIEKMMIDR